MIVLVGLVSCLIIFYRYWKKHYCSKQKTNKFIQHYTFLWFIFCVLRKIMLQCTFEISVFIFIFCQQLNFNFTFYVVNLSSFSNLNSYVEVMLVFSYLQSCYLFEITWPRVCVKLTNLYLPESIHLFQVFFLWINFLF